MTVKRKNMIAASTLILILSGCLFYLYIKKYDYMTTLVRVENHGASICTMDIPSSSCGSYEVNVVLSDGKKATYIVPGYNDEKDIKRYDRINLKITEAKDKGLKINLKVNNKGEILAVL